MMATPAEWEEQARALIEGRAVGERAVDASPWPG